MRNADGGEPEAKGGASSTLTRRVPTYELEVPSRPGMGVRLTEPKPPLQRKNRVQALTAATQA